eukprot:4020918-Pyramimonas_sp.AAC.1
MLPRGQPLPRPGTTGLRVAARLGPSLGRLLVCLPGGVLDLGGAPPVALPAPEPAGPVGSAAAGAQPQRRPGPAEHNPCTLGSAAPMAGHSARGLGQQT